MTPAGARASIGDGVTVSGVRLRLPVATRGVIVLTAATVTLPAAAFARLLAEAGGRAGLSLSGELTATGFRARVPVGPLRLPLSFAVAAGAGGTIEVRPEGGVPGWLVGTVARLAGDRPGIAVSSRGVVSVDPAALMPEGVVLEARVREVETRPDGLRVVLG